MATVDDCCIVCAEALEYTGLGPCGHTSTCSTCIARMRFVMKDTRCIMCKQDQPKVFFTRFMGDYTAKLTQEQFDELEGRGKRGELYHLNNIHGYFDDHSHFQFIKSLIGLTHPYIEERCAEDNEEAPKFKDLHSMKKFVQSKYQLHFCDICLQSRKVFMCEQLLYPKQALDKHMREGDDTGPLSETSFKGHPRCDFCKKRFYDSNEIYQHMEREHENCFLCRRNNPGQYMYFRHYQELEEHFKAKHYLCEHPRCLDRKFVVFNSDHELKRHVANEHGDELKMTKQQRREALTVNLDFQYRDRRHDREAAASSSDVHVPEERAIVIGGGQNVVSRHGRNQQQQGRGQGNMRHSRSTGEMQQAMQASLNDMQPGRDRTFDEEQNVTSVTFTSDDFPSVGEANGGASGGPLGTRWAGAYPAVGAGAGNTGFEEAFPALPTQTRGDKRRANKDKKSLLDHLRAANVPIRVLNRGAGGAGASSSGATSSDTAAAAATASRASRPSPAPPPTPATATASTMHHSRSASALLSAATNRSPSPSPGVIASAQQDDFPGLGGSFAALSGSAAAGSSSNMASAITTPKRAGNAKKNAPAVAITSEDAFPSLPATAAPATSARGSAAPPASAPRFTAVATAFGRSGSSNLDSGNATGGGSSSSPAAPLQPADFPSLPTAPAKTKKNAKSGNAKAAAANQQQQQQSGNANKGGKSSASASRSNSIPEALPSPPSSPLPGVSNDGVSDTIRQANKALKAKIQAQLSDPAEFESFKAESALFQRGEMFAKEYHAKVIAHGMMSLVPELAASCPNPDRRSALLDAHREFLATPAAQDPSAVGPGWVPPEAAMAASTGDSAARWSCSRCTLKNTLDMVACEACGSFRPGYAASSASAFPSLTSAYGGSSSGSSAAHNPIASLIEQASNASLDGDAAGGNKKKGKGTKITIGVGAGQGRNTPKAAPTPAPNAWGGPAAAATASNSAGATNAKQKQGNQWGGGNSSTSGGAKLARMHNALNGAWGE